MRRQASASIGSAPWPPAHSRSAAASAAARAGSGSSRSTQSPMRAATDPALSPVVALDMRQRVAEHAEVDDAKTGQQQHADRAEGDADPGLGRAMAGVIGGAEQAEHDREEAGERAGGGQEAENAGD